MKLPYCYHIFGNRHPASYDLGYRTPGLPHWWVDHASDWPKILHENWGKRWSLSFDDVMCWWFFDGWWMLMIFGECVIFVWWFLMFFWYVLMFVWLFDDCWWICDICLMNLWYLFDVFWWFFDMCWCFLIIVDDS